MYRDESVRVKTAGRIDDCSYRIRANRAIGNLRRVSCA